MKQVIAVLFFLIISASLFAQPHSGEAVPEIKLPDAKGNMIALSSLKGKIVLIDFWASWCGPCRRAIPGLQSVYKKYKDKGFEVYAISLDYDKNGWKKAMFEDNSKWLQVIDPEGNVANAWKVSMIPNSFLLDKEGKLIAVNADDESLDAYLKKVLG